MPSAGKEIRIFHHKARFITYDVIGRQPRTVDALAGMNRNIAVGIVLACASYSYLPASKDKPVMLCFHVTDDGDIEELYNYLKSKGVKMLDEGVWEFSAGG